jgi:DNA-binding NtrC family response regulator
MEKYNILLVDDEENVLNSLTRVLTSNEYKIFKAADGEEAMKVAKSHLIDLIICDYKLPGITGIQFLEKVKEFNPDVLNILLTAHADLEMAVEAINKAVLYKFILKPWDNDSLRLTVLRALEQRSLILQNRQLTKEIETKDKVLNDLEILYPDLTEKKKNLLDKYKLDDESR